MRVRGHSGATAGGGIAATRPDSRRAVIAWRPRMTLRDGVGRPRIECRGDRALLLPRRALAPVRRLPTASIVSLCLPAPGRPARSLRKSAGDSTPYAFTY